jgi:transposase
MSNFRDFDRDTAFLLPPSVDDWLPEKHLARFIVEVIDGLDLSAMSNSYRGSGSESYHPRLLLGLLVYGCATGVFSSRKLERATYDSVAFRFIAANEHPDQDTIAAFRWRFLKEIEALFVQILLLAREMGVLKLGTVALDGTKVHASASKHSAFSYEHAGKIEAQLKAEAAELMAKEFLRVQGLLRTRRPSVVAPRMVTGPILLTGIAFCASCEGAMTLRTGTSRTGIVHRYYACSTCGRQGKTACKGRSIRMDRLDGVVTETVAGQLLHPERVAEMLLLLAERRAEKVASVDARIGRLEKEASLGHERLQRLYRLVEDGLAELDDILRERIASLKAERERATAALERARSASRPEFYISSVLIERFTETMREKLCFGEIPMRKAYLSSIVDRVEVDDVSVRIMGHKDAIEQAVRHVNSMSQPVRSFVPGWLGNLDSNQD